MRPPARGRKAATVAIVAVLGVVVVVLSGMALMRSQPTPPDSSPSELSAVTPTPRDSPTPTPVSSPVAPAEQRFLAFSGDSAWRATAGSCEGAVPLLQRQNDQGEWVDIVPREHTLRQIASLDAYQDGAELVGGMEDACATASLRTFSAGAAWEAYPDALARSRYLDLANPGILHSPAGEIATPCADAAGLRAWGEVVALICDGQAWQQTDATWAALAPTNVKALAVDDTDLIIGHQTPDCDGLALTRASGATTTVIGCAADVDTALPIAIAPTDSGIAVWAADNVIEVAEG